MATINITVQSLLNTAVHLEYTIDDGQTVDQLKDVINNDQSFDSAWYDLVFNETVLSESATLASLNIINDSSLRTHNKIARLATRELRQVAKLDLAALDRAASDYTRKYYDITELPTQYSGNTIVDNENSDGEGGVLLVEGRPWTATSPEPEGYSWTAPSGWAGYEIFNGTAQRLTVQSSSDWAVGTGAFTIEFVVNFQAGGGNFPRVFSLGAYPSATVACSIEGGATPTIYFWIGGSIAASIDTSGPLFTGMPSFVNNFHHVVLQRNTSGYCNIYIDGNKVTNNVIANTYNLNNSSTGITIAAEPGSSTFQNFMKGYLTNFRWTNAAVYPDTSFTVMSSALTALADTKLLLLMATSGTMNDDISGTGKTVTAVLSPSWHAA